VNIVIERRSGRTSQVELSGKKRERVP